MKKFRKTQIFQFLGVKCIHLIGFRRLRKSASRFFKLWTLNYLFYCSFSHTMVSHHTFRSRDLDTNYCMKQNTEMNECAKKCLQCMNYEVIFFRYYVVVAVIIARERDSRHVVFFLYFCCYCFARCSMMLML